MNTITFFIIFLIVIHMGCHDNFKKETFVLPYGYEGWVGVAYGVPQGHGVVDQEGRMVYRVPEDGIVRTSMQFNSGIASMGDIKFVYQIDGNSLREIPISIGKDVNMLNIDSVYVFSVSTIGVDVDDEEVAWDGGTIYAVGRPSIMDSLYSSKIEFIDRMYMSASVSR